MLLYTPIKKTKKRVITIKTKEEFLKIEDKYNTPFKKTKVNQKTYYHGILENYDNDYYLIVDDDEALNLK